MEESSQTIVQNPASTQQCVSYRYSTARFIFSSTTLYFSLKWCAWPSLCIIPLALLSSFTPVAILWYYLLLFSSFLLFYISSCILVNKLLSRASHLMLYRVGSSLRPLPRSSDTQLLFILSEWFGIVDLFCSTTWCMQPWKKRDATRKEGTKRDSERERERTRDREWERDRDRERERERKWEIESERESEREIESEKEIEREREREREGERERDRKKKGSQFNVVDYQRQFVLLWSNLSLSFLHLPYK